MLHAVSFWLLVAAFSAAGLINAIGMPAVKRDFARWAYPRWWCYLTGGLEIATAFLIVFPASRTAGLTLGALIVAVAILTVLRHREFSRFAPLGVFAALLALVQFSS